jgi:hypothetical protein
MVWLIGLLIWGAFLFFAWALCVVAGRADEWAERQGGTDE